MLELTKFLCLHNKLFSQKVPIQDDAPMQVHFVFHVNVFFIPEVVSSRTNIVSSLSSIPIESIFRILVISFTYSSMCPSMEI